MIVALLLASCTKEMRFHELPLADGDKVPVELTCEPLDFELEEGTKSHLGNNILTKVSNVNYYLFDKEGNFVSQGYTEDLGEFGIALPDIDAHYQCFFFANVGRFAIPETTKASEMGTAVHYDFQSYDNYSSSVENNGFPMAAGVADFNKVNAGNVTVKRLVHTLRVKINTAALNASQLTVKNVRVRQAPRDFFPFAEKSKLTEQFTDKTSEEYGADWLSAEEVEKINNGEEVRLYILENMRGELIPGNTEWKNKTPQNIENRPEASKATYIEIETSVVTPTANYDNVVYRAYLGKSPSNFDVQRSTSFLLTNVFTSDMIPDEDWRIDPGTPVITGSLEFRLPNNNANLNNIIKTRYGWSDNLFVNITGKMVPSEKIASSSSNAYYLTDGFEQSFFIYRSNPNIKYKVEITPDKNTRPYLDYTITRYDSNYDRITLKSCKTETFKPADSRSRGHEYLSNGDITGVDYNSEVPNKTYPVSIKIISEDGLISDQIKINYFYGKMGVAMRIGSLGEEISIGNPMKLVTSVNNSGKVRFFYNGMDARIQMKSNIGVDKAFLKYVGSLTSLTGKYGDGNQTTPLHILPFIGVADYNNVELRATLASFGAFFTLGASLLPILFDALDSETGTMEGWPVVFMDVPFEGRTTLYYNNGSGKWLNMVTLADGLEAPTQFWGDYEHSIEGWRYNESLRDVFQSFSDGKGYIIATNTRTHSKMKRYPCPFSYQQHVDLLLGGWTDVSCYEYPSTILPYAVLSYQKGLALSGGDTYVMSMSNLPSNYVELNKKLFLDQTLAYNNFSSRTEPFAGKISYIYHDDAISTFGVLKDRYVDFSNYPHFTRESIADYLKTVSDLQKNEAGTTEANAAGTKLVNFTSNILKLPAGFETDFNSDYFKPTVKASGTDIAGLISNDVDGDGAAAAYIAASGDRKWTTELWDILKLSGAHYYTYTLNHFIDYIAQ